MLELVLNDEHLGGALGRAIGACRHRLLLATANVKDLHLPAGQGGRDGAVSILDVFEQLTDRSVEVRLLHGGVPSGPFLEHLKRHQPANLQMRRCPRVHLKALVVDGRWMYLGSANLTGAGLGAKSALRRNFEAGIWTDQLDLIDPVVDLAEAIWTGQHCRRCGRKKYCPVPLEQPELV